MNWDDLLAFALFIAAFFAVGWRAYRALHGNQASGCGASCGSCSASAPASSGGNLLLIEPASNSHDAKR